MDVGSSRVLHSLSSPIDCGGHIRASCSSSWRWVEIQKPDTRPLFCTSSPESSHGHGQSWSVQAQGSCRCLSRSSSQRVAVCDMCASVTPTVLQRNDRPENKSQSRISPPLYFTVLRHANLTWTEHSCVFLPAESATSTYIRP